MASIYKRGKTYSVSLSLGIDENGKRNRYTKGGFKTKKEAEKHLDKIKQMYYQGDFLQNDKMLLKEVMKIWFQDYVLQNLADNTISGYKNNIYKHIIPKIGNLEVTAIKPYHIQAFYSALVEEGLAPASINYIHRNLRAAFNYAAKMDMFCNTVFEKVIPPKIPKYHPSILNADESKKLIDLARDTEIYLPILLAITLGLRRGEVLGLCWGDLNLEKHLLRIQRSASRRNGEGMVFSTLKTKSSYRTLVIQDEIISVLAEEQKRQEACKKIYGNIYNEHNLICCRKTGGFITSNYLDHNFKKILLENGLPDIRFHDLRHTNATLLVENNVSMKTVSERLGHSSTSITMDIYAQYTSQMQEQCTEVLGEVLFKS